MTKGKPNMKLAQAKETARKINGQDVPIAYRNVWGFFPPDEEDAPKLPIVLITKDGSNPPRQGVFLNDGTKDGFIDYECSPLSVYVWKRNRPGEADEPTAERVWRTGARGG